MLYNEFLLKFGENIAIKLTLFYIKLFNINWLNQVSEEKLNGALAGNFYTMFSLLHHEELNPDKYIIKIKFDENDGLIAYMEKDQQQLRE